MNWVGLKRYVSSVQVVAVAALVGVLGSLALGGCGAVLKPPDPSRRLELVTKGTMFDAPNGYKFVVLDEPEANFVRVDVRYPVGSAHDPEGKEGLAHLVEHLLFEIEIGRPQGPTSIMKEMSAAATMTNAETWADYTQYISEGKPENLEALLMLETERLLIGCKGLSKEVFEHEREVVLNELRERSGGGAAELLATVMQAVYPAGHPYRRSDSVDSVARLTLDDACAFIDDQYRRGQAIVVVSGKTTDEQVRYAVGGTLTRLPNRRADALPIPAFVAPKPERLRIKANVKQTTVVAAWPMPPRYTKEYRVVSGYLGDIANFWGGYSMLYNWGHSGSASVVGGVHAPQALVAITLDAGTSVDDAVSYLEKSVRGAMPARISEKSERAWEDAALGVLHSYERLSGRARLFLDFVQYEPSSGYLSGRVEEMKKMPESELIDLPKRWFDLDRARIVVLEPGEGTNEARVTSGTFSGGHQPRRTIVDPALADRPLNIAVPEGLRLATEKYVTSNGLTVVLWPHGKVPLVRASLVVSSGSAHEPLDREGVARFQRASSLRLDQLTFEGDDLSIRMDELIAGIGWPLRSPGGRFSDEMRDRLKESLGRAELPEQVDHWHAYYKALYGDEHPYARRGVTAKALDGLTLDRVTAWGRDHVVPANSTLIIAGQFDAALVKKHIAYQTDQVSRGSDSPKVSSRPDGRQAIIASWVQKPMPIVQLGMGFSAGRGVDADHPRRLVLEEVIREKFADMRERLGVSYGFSAEYVPRDGGGEWWIYGDADASRAAEAAKAMVSIVEEIRRDPESIRSAFVAARQRVIDRYLVREDNSDSVLPRLAFRAQFDLDDGHDAATFAAVARLTLASFHPFVVKELAKDVEVISVFGNKDAVTAAQSGLRN